MDYNIGLKYSPVLLIKFLFSGLNGFLYTIFMGSFCGYDRDEFKEIYSPTKLKFNNLESKTVVVDIRPNNTCQSSMQMNKKEGGKSVLILGQYFDKQLKRNDALNLLSCFCNWLFNYGIEEINYFYKAHPLKRSLEMEMMLKKKGVIFFDSNVGVEDMIMDDFFKVVSISSTALMTLKIIYGDDIICEAFGLDFLDRHTSMNYSKVKDIYISMGVICSEIG